MADSSLPKIEQWITWITTAIITAATNEMAASSVLFVDACVVIQVSGLRGELTPYMDHIVAQQHLMSNAANDEVDENIWDDDVVSVDEDDFEIAASIEQEIEAWTRKRQELKRAKGIKMIIR